MDRVTGNDESYLLAERLFGLSAPIQFCWVLPEDPGSAALQSLNDELARGVLARRVVGPRVPFARARWVRADDPPSFAVETEPVDDSAVADWFDARVRSVDLDPAGGRGWRLDAVPTRGGRLAVSLLASHMVADGQGINRALAAASSGSSRNPLPAADVATGTAGIRADLVDAVTQIGSAARSLAVLAALVPTAVRTRRRARADTSGVPTSSAPPTDLVHQTRSRADDRDHRGAPSPDSDVPGPTLALYDLDRAQWAARAADLGGTSNSLFTGVIAGLAHRAGVAVHAPQMRVCIAVSKREGDDDTRANASGGVWIRLDEPVSAEAGLADIRARSKQAFVDYAQSGDRQAADNLQPVVRLLPTRLIASMMSSVPGPDTTVSNLGAVPDTTLSIGGVTAESFAIRALMQGQTAAMRRVTGPALAAWAVEYGSTVTIAFFGVNPDHFGDPATLHKNIRAELDAWQLGHAAW